MICAAPGFDGRRYAQSRMNPSKIVKSFAPPWQRHIRYLTEGELKVKELTKAADLTVTSSASGEAFGLNSMVDGMTEIFINMAEKNKSSDILVQECLKSLGISLLGDWDVLIFLHRHQVILASSEQIARLLGYPNEAVSDALDRLESQGLVQRSRASQGVRLYQFVFSEAHLAPESCFRRLMSLAENRSGRLLVAKRLRKGVEFHVAAKGKKE
jgi:hypothetical protein